MASRMHYSEGPVLDPVISCVGYLGFQRRGSAPERLCRRSPLHIRSHDGSCTSFSTSTWHPGPIDSALWTRPTIESRRAARSRVPLRASYLDGALIRSSSQRTGQRLPTVLMP